MLRITSAKGYTLKSSEEDEKINIEVESNKKIKDEPITPPVEFPFQEVTKKLNERNSEGNPIYLEDYIEKLASPDEKQVNDNLEKILTYVKEVHTNLNLQGNVYGIKAREAGQHGFVAGIFDNFRYRDNTKIYLEQFAGRGYADVVLLVRGPDRAVDSVPILIELKAGTKGKVTPSDALRQAEDYVEGFRPSKMRVLTNAGNAIAVGLNLDSAELFKTEVKSIRQPSSTLMEDFVELVSKWNNQQVSEEVLKQQVTDLLSSEYHTFPANKETRDIYYFSRYIVGQSILVNGFDGTDMGKYVFSYNEYPLESKTRDGTQSKERPVTTLVFMKGGKEQDKTAFIFHIIEQETKIQNLDSKKIPVTDISEVGGIGNVIEITMGLKKYKENSSFKDLFEIKQISKYNPSSNDQQFTGNFLKIPNSDELKAKFDQAITSQHATSSNSEVSLQAYKGLLTEVADAIYPIKDLIINEARLQAVLNGLLSSYSDLKLKETSTQQGASAKIVIIPEFQTGAGGRVDMVIQGIGPSPQGTREYTPMGLEFKLIDKNLNQDQLKQEVDELTKEQTTRYAKGAALKTITDSDKMFFMGVVVNVKAKDKNSLILTSNELVPAKVVHSSTHVLPTVDKSDLSRCLGQGNRRKRSTNGCLFSWDDIDKFNTEKVDKRNKGKIKIDNEKFLTYIKDSQDEGKSAQLVEFIGEKVNPSIEGDHKYLLNEVVQDGGYVNYAQNKRIKDLQNDVLQQDSGLAKNLKLKSRLINAAGRIQLIRGIHGAIVSCKDGTATDCGLNLGGIAWSFASQPIENVMVKITPKVVASAEKVVGKVIPGTLGKQTKFAIRVVGVKVGTTVAKGVAGALTGVFDMVDIGMSASNLVDCKNRENGDNPCGEKEIRDNIASISFSSASFVSGVALTAAGMPGIGIAVGAGLMLGYGVYSGVSNIVEYEKKYDTTHDENWRIFLHTFALQPIPLDVQHFADRQNIVNSLAQEAWKALSNSTSNVVAYAVGLGKVSNGALHPSNAKIIMDRDNADTASLSRVIPNTIPNAEMVCLPHITDADYEKGWKKSVPTAIHYCDNAMVIADERRKSSGKTIVYDLKNIDEGVVVGSDKFNNDFLIFHGTTEIAGGNGVVNRFVFFNNTSFLGKVIGGGNSTNILDLSQSGGKVIKVDVSNVSHQSLKVRINDRLLISDSAGDNLSGYRYAGRQNKVDKILCTDYSKSLTVKNNRDVIIDSGSGFDNDVRDIVENCEKVIISPYTTVKGRKSVYAFYVKTAGYKDGNLRSEINVEGTGKVIFPETDLLSDCDEITYSSDNNTLSLKIGLGQNNQYTLDIKNYIEQSSDKPNFILIDKSGSNIVPKIGKSESSTVKINSFELHAEYSLDDFDAVENHYKKILNNNKDYKVFGVVRDKVQSQSNSTVPHMMFGSSGDDIINFDQGTIFVKGGEGSDVYVVSGSIGEKEVKIANNSDDKKLDMLFMPEVPKEFSVQQCNLYLNYNNTRIQVEKYLQGGSYAHFMIMNSKKETFIPYIESISCVGSSMKNGKLVPFFHATQTQNVFFLSKGFQYDHVVIDSRSEDVEQYKYKDDLLLMREGEVPFTMKIKGYFDDQSGWKDVNFHLWNNGNFSNFDLPQEIDEVMSYQDKLKADYERIVKEYVIDFTQSINIAHNQNDDLTSVGQDEERVGLMILKDITPGQVKVSSSGSDLVLHDTKSNRAINIKNWDSSESHRISTLEFDLGLDPIVIRRLNRFSLSNVEEIQTLIDKASENYQNKADGTETENDFKCLVSVNGLESGNKTYECLGFSLLQDQINFTEKLCSVEKIEEFKNKMQNSDQVLTLIKKLKDDLLLIGYDQNAIGQCNELMVTLEFKPLISKVAQEGEWNKVKAFLDETANRSSTDIENKNKWSESWTLLHYAVYNGNLNLVNGVFDLLLAKVGDINAKDKWCWTPLHYAVYYNEPNMVKFLIDKGANIEARSKKSETPLYLAVKEGKLDVVKSLFGESIDDNSYKMIKLIRSLKEEIISRASTPSNVKEWAVSYVSSMRDSIKGIAKKELKNGMLDDSYASTTELADKIYNFDEKLFDEIIKKVVNDLYKEIDTEEMLSFIRSYNSATQRIQGYVAVFDKMKRENNLNNNAVFNLAFYVKEVMEAGDYNSVNSEKRSELKEIKKELPGSLRNLVFSSKVCIKNVEYGRYLYSPNDYKDFQFDSDRRRVFTWSSNLGGDQFKWKVELNGDNVYLKNVEYGRYLYSPNDYKDFQFDSDRRRVFTWSSNLGGDQFKWKVELNGDNVYLKNVEYGRYLYSPNDYKDFQFDSDRRRVFTWSSNLGGDQFKWKVENCGSTRKMRDTQHHGKSLQEEGRPVYLESREVNPREELKYLISEAAKNGEWDIVNFFLDKTAERSPDYIAIKDQFSTSWTTLHYAVYNGDLNLVEDVLELLPDKETIVNARDSKGWTPLHYAVYYNRPKIVAFLIYINADIDAETSTGETVFQMIEDNESEVAKILFISHAINKRELDEARLLLGQNVHRSNVQARKKDRYSGTWTFLHYAVYNGDVDLFGDLFQLLLNESDGNIDAKDKCGWTPLHYAAYYGERDMIDFLISKEAEVDARNDSRNTPLHIAAKEGNYDSVKVLLEKGADINSKNLKYETPLDLANKYDHSEVGDLLEEAKERGDNGGTQQSIMHKPNKQSYRGHHQNSQEEKRGRRALIEGVASEEYSESIASSATRVSSLKDPVTSGTARPSFFIKDYVGWLGGVFTSSLTLLGKGFARIGSFIKSEGASHSIENVDSAIENNQAAGRPSSRKLLAMDLTEKTARQDVLKDSLQNGKIDYTKGGATSGADKPSPVRKYFPQEVVEEDVKGFEVKIQAICNNWGLVEDECEEQIVKKVKANCDVGSHGCVNEVLWQTEAEIRAQAICFNSGLVENECREQVVEKVKANCDVGNHECFDKALWQAEAEMGAQAICFTWVFVRDKCEEQIVKNVEANCDVGNHECFNKVLGQAEAEMGAKAICFNSGLVEDECEEQIVKKVKANCDVGSHGCVNEVLWQTEADMKAKAICNNFIFSRSEYKCEERITETVKDNCYPWNLRSRGCIDNTIQKAQAMQKTVIGRLQDGVFVNTCSILYCVFLFSTLAVGVRKKRMEKESDEKDKIEEEVYKVLEEIRVCEKIGEAIGINISMDDIYNTTLGRMIIIENAQKDQIVDVLFYALRNLREIKLKEDKDENASNEVKKFLKRRADVKAVLGGISEDIISYQNGRLNKECSKEILKKIQDIKKVLDEWMRCGSVKKSPLCDNLVEDIKTSLEQIKNSRSKEEILKDLKGAYIQLIGVCDSIEDYWDNKSTLSLSECKVADESLSIIIEVLKLFHNNDLCREVVSTDKDMLECMISLQSTIREKLKSEQSTASQKDRLSVQQLSQREKRGTDDKLEKSDLKNPKRLRLVNSEEKTRKGHDQLGNIGLLQWLVNNRQSGTSNSSTGKENILPHGRPKTQEEHFPSPWPQSYLSNTSVQGGLFTHARDQGKALIS
ncbi:ankyrin repeat domain-containing protein [Wolbachia endosymbiont (group A) of Agelastica alni]|uniref:ankyrin repeat domain-containing protein n=1 Tax=Wolbachia endosymbiont (group A) of Agelastica alni TaxID=3066130 RepID=UPI0033426627